MLGSGGFIVYNDTFASYAILGTLLVLSSRKLWTMPHVVKVQDGWKVLHRIENGHGREEDIDLL
jgi:NADH-quinone oxidoreductase subunit F